MARGSAPIGLGLAGIAAVVVLSGVQGQSIAEILKGEFGADSKKPFPDPAYAGSSGGGSSASTSTGSTVGTSTGTGVISHSAGPGGSLPPDPRTIRLPGNLEGIRQYLEHGLNYKEALEDEVRRGRISQSHATTLFNQRYPQYRKKYEEAKLAGG